MHSQWKKLFTLTVLILVTVTSGAPADFKGGKYSTVYQATAYRGENVESLKVAFS